MKEKQFIQKGARKVRLHEFLEEELEGAGYSHCDIVRTPTSTKVVIHAQRPGLVIGRGGSRIKELTKDMEKEFDFENSQIEVNEIEEPDSDARIVAQSIADWLEKGGHAKRVGFTYIRRMKEAGLIGAEVEIAGKLSGNRGRTEKFSFGYVKRCGNTSKANVDKAYELARTKPGAIGVKVRIMKEMPEFMHRKVQVDKEILHESSEGEEAQTEAEKAEAIDKVLQEADNMTSAELERAMEDSTELNTEQISKQEIREAFEQKDEEETTEKVKETNKPNQEKKAEDASSDAEDLDYEEIVSGTITDAKEQVTEQENPDYDALLEAEKQDKNRKTFIEWIENQ